jgi:hypothetical protein
MLVFLIVTPTSSEDGGSMLLRNVFNILKSPHDVTTQKNNIHSFHAMRNSTLIKSFLTKNLCRNCMNWFLHLPIKREGWILQLSDWLNGTRSVSIHQHESERFLKEMYARVHCVTLPEAGLGLFFAGMVQQVVLRVREYFALQDS